MVQVILKHLLEMNRLPTIRPDRQQTELTLKHTNELINNPFLGQREGLFYYGKIQRSLYNFCRQKGSLGHCWAGPAGG